MKPAFRRRPTPAESKRALAQVQRLFSMTPIERARDRFIAAKSEYTAAAEALIRQDAGAAERADRALATLNTARDALRALNAQEETE